jgi:hypothetical protein
VLLVWRGRVVGGGCQDAGMAGAKMLRRIADPVVAGPAAGVRIRTRIRVSGAKAGALTAIGTYLGSMYRGELAGRIRCGVLDHDGHAAWRAERKQAVTAVSSSRWAGAITRAVEDQFQLGMRALAAQVTDLRSAVQVLEARCALRPGETRTGRRRFRSTPASCRGGRDRATWPRSGHQASAGGTPQRTADRRGHSTGQARPPAERHITTVRQFRPTDTPQGVPVHRTTPAASGQHRSGRKGLAPAH